MPAKQEPSAPLDGGPQEGTNASPSLADNQKLLPETQPAVAAADSAPIAKPEGIQEPAAPKSKKTGKRSPGGNAAGGPGAPKADTPVAVENARYALSYVGADEEAETVWVATINDPTIDAKSRQDLIEDLNEDGFPDKKNLTSDDLPLIMNRLALIEQLGPDALDEVNSAAFAEAYKDLVNMAWKAMATE